MAKVRDFLFSQKDAGVALNEKLQQEIILPLKEFINTLLKRPRHHWHSNTAGHMQIFSLKKWLHLHSIWHWYHRKCLLYISGGNQTCTKQPCLCSSTMWQCNKIYLNGSVTWYFKIYEGTLGSSIFPFFFPSFLPMQGREANNPALGYQLPLLRAWSEQRARYSCAEF